MKCKPGDLAVIIKARDERNLGLFVRIVKEFEGIGPPSLFGGCGWVIDKAYFGCELGEIPIAEDEQLRPIRDPGDDARDETLDWLPAPKKQTESA